MGNKDYQKVYYNLFGGDKKLENFVDSRRERV
jgi:hypothetical protein